MRYSSTQEIREGIIGFLCDTRKEFVSRGMATEANELLEIFNSFFELKTQSYKEYCTKLMPHFNKLNELSLMLGHKLNDTLQELRSMATTEDYRMTRMDIFNPEDAAPYAIYCKKYHFDDGKEDFTVQVYQDIIVRVPASKDSLLGKTIQQATKSLSNYKYELI